MCKILHSNSMNKKINHNYCTIIEAKENTPANAEACFTITIYEIISCFWGVYCYCNTLLNNIHFEEN